MSSMYGRVYTGWLRARAKMKRERQYAILRMLKKEQWFALDKIAKLQVSRLHALLDHARQHSPYYRDRLPASLDIRRDIADIHDLARLPLLTRSDLQQNYRRILCPGDKGVYQDASGGSTGNPVIFYHDDQYKAFAAALEHLFLSWIHISRGDRTGVFWGADRDFKEWSLKERLFFKLERFRLLNSFNVTETALDEYLQELQKFQPHYIFGYASSLHLAAKYINRTGKYTIRPRAVRSSAEMLYDSMRRDIEKAFGTDPYNYYGSREINNLGAECPEHQGLHVMASGRIAEVVDKEGNRLPDGQMGYLAVTDLTNFCFPFIRYLNGDMAIMKPTPCTCDRGYPLLEKITGRSSDILVVNGKFIHGEYFTHLFYGQPDVRQFQVVQEKPDYLVIKIVAVTKKFDTSTLIETIKHKVGENITIKAEFVDSIPLLNSGKYRFTINKTQQ
ncbi:MAG: phenylacetate--CoA ligase family protein [Candidatus Zixiibacteriota bacterium]|nr:MAG: phenylacetate--CoA ligase family protein [candidate division Zixibacteria bacterium]